MLRTMFALATSRETPSLFLFSKRELSIVTCAVAVAQRRGRSPLSRETVLETKSSVTVVATREMPSGIALHRAVLDVDRRRTVDADAVDEGRRRSARARAM